MPDPTVPAPRQPDINLRVTLQGLGAAHTTVHAVSGLVSVEIGTPDVRVTLLDDLPVVRQVLTDALAQLDAIAAQGSS